MNPLTPRVEIVDMPGVRFVVTLTGMSWPPTDLRVWVRLDVAEDELAAVLHPDVAAAVAAQVYEQCVRENAARPRGRLSDQEADGEGPQ